MKADFADFLRLVVCPDLKTLLCHVFFDQFPACYQHFI